MAKKLHVAGSLGDSGGVTSWNDLEDRPFYTEEGTVTDILPETTLEYLEDMGGYPFPQMNSNLVAGETYTVVLDGVSYTCVAKGIDIESITAACLGDIYTNTQGMMGTEADATGEPFAIIYYGFEAMPGMYGAMMYEGTDPVTLHIFSGGDIVHKLDNKYLDLEWIPAPIMKDATLHEDTLEFSDATEQGAKLDYTLPFDIENEKKYTVIWNDTAYTCVGRFEEKENENGYRNGVKCLGNATLSAATNGYELCVDTGEPFGFIIQTINGMTLSSVLAYENPGSTSVALKIRGMVETREPIPQNYLDPKNIKGMYYTEVVESGSVEILPETTVQGNEYGEMGLPTTLNLVEGETYVVNWNGTEYSSVAVAMNEDGITIMILGDVYTMSGGMMGTAPTGEPFVIMDYGMDIIGDGTYGMMMDMYGAESVTFSISQAGGGEVVHKLDNKYLDLEWIPAPMKVEKTVFDGSVNLNNSGTTGAKLNEPLFQITEDQKYKITTSDGTECECTAKITTGKDGVSPITWIGNNSLSPYIFNNNDIPVVDTGEPILYYLSSSNGYIYSEFATNEAEEREITVSVSSIVEIRKPMPKEYMPDIEELNANIINGSAAGSLRTISSASEDNSYTLGENAFAEGEGTKAEGRGAHAEGWCQTASGDASHAEGSSTTASGFASHAEGYATTASNNNDHAEGSSTTASGTSSHAEGDGTLASGFASHAEGYYTIAEGDRSHAEGWETKALGHASHAEGEGTISNGDCSHVQGRYNLGDTAGKYAHIVGNGEARGYESNAYTLDWDGNGWFAGTVDGTGLILRSSTDGSTEKIRFTADDTGTLIVTAESTGKSEQIATKSFVEELLGVIENGTY